MRGLLTRLIQENNQSNSQRQNRAPQTRRRAPFMFQSQSSRGRRSTPSTPSAPSTPSTSAAPSAPSAQSTPPPSAPSTPIRPSHHSAIHPTTNISNTPIFSAPLESNENTSNYYSLFEYNDYNIRYYHNQRIQYDDSLEIINSILQYIYEPEDTEFEEPHFEPEPFKGNDDNMKNLIMCNMFEAQYKNVKNGIKNDSCPILYTPFEDNDTICVFKQCNHGIHQSTQDQFLYHFQKCPLCNVSLNV